MHLRYFWLIFLCIFCIQFSAAQPGFQSPRLNALLKRHGWIRVALDESASRADITLPAGGVLLLDTKSVTCSAGTVTARPSAGSVSVTIPGKGTVTAHVVQVSPAGQGLQYNNRSYRGKLHISGGRSLLVVNEILIDDWLKGVLPAEIGSDAPLEALKAQAVTGRSEAIFRLLNPPHADSGYDFCNGPHCQAYKGVEIETPEIQQACDTTLGYVLVAGGDIVNAVYHNVCGGVTAGAEDVWDSKPLPGLVPVYDKIGIDRVDLSTDAAVRQFLEETPSAYFCYSGNPEYANYAKKYFRWSKTLSAAEAGRMAGIGNLTDIRVTERTLSGRVRRLTVTGSGGSKTFEKELNIRNVFDLWSGLFVLNIDTSDGRLSSVTFMGGGNGHGVGLCQHGAREIARRGGTFDQILGHYYRGAKLRRIYRP